MGPKFIRGFIPALVVHFGILSSLLNLRTNCLIAEEFSSHKLECTASQQTIWERKEQNKWVTVATCTIGSGCNTVMQEFYRSTITSVLKGQITTLTILSVNRNFTNYKCVQDDGSRTFFELEVYVKASVPVCKGAQLQNTGNSAILDFNCVSDQVYPQGNCDFKVKGLPEMTRTHVSFNNSQSPIRLGDYSVNCALHIVLDGLSAGIINLTLEPTFYPELSEYVEASSTTISWTHALLLSLPQVSLSNSLCPSGPMINNSFIMAKSRASCKCQLDHRGFPPAKVQWYTSNGTPVGSFNDTDGSATVNFVAGDSGYGEEAQFVCLPETLLTHPQATKIIFQPQIAYGPQSLYPVMEPKVFDLCPSQTFATQFICRAPGEFVNPSPLFTIMLNDDKVLSNAKGSYLTNHNQYEAYYTFRPSSGGQLRVYCKATNSAFDSLSKDAEARLEVREPPKEAPVIKTNDNQPTEGSSVAYISSKSSTIDIICVVNGGFPEVSNVTIVCGSHFNTQQGNRATLSIANTETFTSQRCVCSAWHITQCYNKRADLLIMVGSSAPATSSVTDKNPSVGEDSSSNSATMMGIVIGLGIALFIAILLVIIIVVRYCKKNARKTATSRRQQSLFPYDQPQHVDSQQNAYNAIQGGTATFRVPPRPLPTTPDPETYMTINDGGEASITPNQIISENKGQSPFFKKRDSNEYIRPLSDMPLYDRDVTTDGEKPELNDYLEPIPDSPTFGREETLMKRL